MTEEQLYQKIVELKRERDLLYVIFEELDDLLKAGYNTPESNTSMNGVLYAHQEYIKWKANSST